MVRDTWHILSGSRFDTCQVESKSNIKLKWDPCEHVASHEGKEIHY